MKRVVLINSPYDLMKKGYNSRTKIRRGFFPPLGIGYIAANLIKEGFEVNVIDAVVEQMEFPAVISQISELKPDFVGLSVMTPGYSEAYKLAAMIRRDLQDLPIIVGGPHANSFPEEIMANCRAVDFVMSGECELTLPRLLKNMGNYSEYAQIPGLYYRDSDGGFAIGAPPEFEPALDKIPFPARHLFKNELYIPLPNFSRRLPATSVITSRGCPYRRCKFCY